LVAVVVVVARQAAQVAAGLVEQQLLALAVILLLLVVLGVPVVVLQTLGLLHNLGWVRKMAAMGARLLTLTAARAMGVGLLWPMWT
jgi:hypothetical protein